MRFGFWICLAAVLPLFSACRTQQLDLPTHPIFRQRSIESKTWDENWGFKIQFLGWKTVNLKAGEVVKIAEFGDANTKQITSLEFYRFEADPPQDWFILLGTDSWRSVVTKIDIHEADSSTEFEITRQTDERPQMEHRYSVLIDKNGRFGNGIHHFINQVGELDTK